MPSGYRTDLDGERAASGKQARARWGKTMRAAFFDHLAATCNVTQSAAAANVDVRTVYRLRRRDERFAARWEAALALGYQMVETLLVGHVLAGNRPGDTVDAHASAQPPIDFDAAMRLLAAHRNPAGKPRKGGGTLQFAASDETDTVLLKRLKAIEMRRARAAEWAAQVEAGKAQSPLPDAADGGPSPHAQAASNGE